MAKKADKANEEKQAEIKNIVTVEDSGPCKKKISIEVPREKIQETLSKQYSQLRRDAEIPGFRKGRAPQRLLEKRFGKDVLEQTKLTLLAEASEEAIKDNEIDSLGEPDINHADIVLPEEGAMKFEFEVEVRPTFKLPELEGIPVDKPKMEVSDDAVEAEVGELQKRLGTWKPKDGPVKEDDQVIADVTLKTDDDEDSKNNVEIAVRDRGFAWKVPIEGLVKVLKGAKSGDTKKTTVEIPETFFDEAYRGKKVDVEIKVGDVKELIAAEMNDDFFEKFGVKDLDDLKDAIRQRSQQQLEGQVRQAMQAAVHKYLLDKVDFDLPASVVADQSQQLLQRQYMKLLQQGTQAAEVVEQLDELKASSEEQAKNQLKSFFIIDEIARKFEIQTSDEEVNGYIAQMAMYKQMRPEKMREQMSKDGSLSQAVLEIREQKCIDKLLESAKITEVEPEKAAKKTATKKTTTKKTVKKATAKPAAKKTEKAEKATSSKKKTVSKKKTTSKKKSSD
ncbi:MAG: trigger factor [Anaerohalosphaeraceae bacterium]|nr:trigger factor [Anaerohalosphaeraceae bacterium]